MVNDIVKDLEGSVAKAHDSLKRELAKVRTGRANLALLDGVRVDYYGTPTPLNQVASLSTPDARLIVIKPWEKKLIPQIEEAIRNIYVLGYTSSNLQKNGAFRKIDVTVSKTDVQLHTRRGYVAE